MDDILVSCIIPTYKRFDTLERAINSCLNQTFKNIEVLVVNDNDNDSQITKDVYDLVSSIATNDSRVKFIRQVKHINGAEARNAGIRAAKGKYIAFLDDDDEWKNNKLELQVDFLENSNYDGATCLYEIYKDNEIISKNFVYDCDDLQFKVLSRQVAIFTPTFIGKKSVIEKFGAFDNSLSRHQDLQFFTEFLNYGKIGLVDEYLVNVYVDSTINVPNTKKLIEVKEKYFESIKSSLEKYPKRRYKRIMKAHYFEVLIMSLKEKKFGIFIKYFFKIGFSISAYKDVYKRYKARKKMK